MRVSAVIPTLNEAPRIGALAASLLGQGCFEVIVADGGSEDNSAAVAAAAGALVVVGPPGRGRQMRQGAAAAAGDALFFVHADTSLPAGAVAALSDALARPGVVAGAFRIRFSSRSPLLAVYGALSALNLDVTTYGDQGLFVQRSTYESVGGFAPIPILEDLEIQDRLRPLGRFVKLPLALETSARRFQQEGVLRRQLANMALVAAFRLGAPPDRLAGFYRPQQTKRGQNGQRAGDPI